MCPISQQTQRPQTKQSTPPPIHTLTIITPLNTITIITHPLQLAPANRTRIMQMQPRNNTITMIQMFTRHLSHFPSDFKLIFTDRTIRISGQMLLSQHHRRQSLDSCCLRWRWSGPVALIQLLDQIINSVVRICLRWIGFGIPNCKPRSGPDKLNRTRYNNKIHINTKFNPWSFNKVSDHISTNSIYLICR